MSDGAVQALIDELAERLQRSVVIDDPRVRLLYASPHYGDEDQVRTRAVLQRNAGKAAIGHVLAQGVAHWTSAGVIPAAPEIGMHARVCVPIRWRAELIALLLVVDAGGTMTTSELGMIGSVGEELAALMIGEHEASIDPERREREAAVGDLFDSEGAVRRGAIRTLAAGVDSRVFDHVRAVELDVRGGRETSPSHVAAALRHAVETPDAALALAMILPVVRERSATVVVASRQPIADSAVDRYGERLIKEVRDLAAGRFDASVGVGSQVAGLEQVWSSGKQARLACRAAASVVPDAVVNWTSLGVHALLLRLPSAEIESETLPDEIQRLLAVDKDGRLVETLRAFLDHAGDVPTTAEALHIHRTTLYYRLERIATLADLDLGSGETRLVLHMSLRVMDMIARGFRQ
ncbi:PucR family transcriptional regulator [Nocardioides acrostichi]|uniref:Helix-turn-helix domain-containing protein n=1 Tax=Nocardioides acrostichi TaxID=2784339 RepID=A0A930UX94_9ACTN|nr:helix-turn-helix domain-containing protein [Nocardioides acrostichi]MBF4160750.1 helix-turn-helix domain-containing protein [Nocardioides acrostichi]